MDDVLVYLGGQVKALDDNGKVGGYLVLYGNPKEADISNYRDYFTANTDFDIEDGAKSTVYFNHGFDPILKTRKLGRAELRKDDFGVWAETILSQRDEYEKFVLGLVKEGKIGWSSGTLPNLVERKQVGDTHEILKWSLGGDASLTHTPADYRNTAVALKSVPLIPLETNTTAEAQSEGSSEPIAAQGVIEQIKTIGDETMTDTQTPPADNEAMKALEAKFAEQSAKMDTLIKMMENAPALNDAGYVSDTGGTSDANVKSLGDFLLAVKRHDIKRIEKIYGSTKDMSGDVGAQGAFLVPETYHAQLIQWSPLENPILSRVKRIPVTNPSGRFPVLDQYFAPTAGVGQTAAGGRMTTAARAEGGTYTETQAQFEELAYLVSDAASGYVEVTKELRADSVVMIESLIKSLINIVVNAKLEYYILRGTGAGQPLGIIGHAATVAVTPDSDNTFAYADAVEMLTRFRSAGGSPVWICHPSILTDIAAFAVASGSPVVWAANLAERQPGTLLGYPIVISEHMPQANGDNPLLADLSAYALFEKGGLYIDYSEHVGFLSGKDTWRFGVRVDGKPLFQAPITLGDPTGSFTQSPFVLFDD